MQFPEIDEQKVIVFALAVIGIGAMYFWNGDSKELIGIIVAGLLTMARGAGPRL